MPRRLNNVLYISALNVDLSCRSITEGFLVGSEFLFLMLAVTLQLPDKPLYNYRVRKLSGYSARVPNSHVGRDREVGVNCADIVHSHDCARILPQALKGGCHETVDMARKVWYPNSISRSLLIRW